MKKNLPSHWRKGESPDGPELSAEKVFPTQTAAG